MVLACIVVRNTDDNNRSSVFSQLIQGLVDGEEEFVKEMKDFASHHLETGPHVLPSVLTQRETVFRNISDIILLHER